MKSIIPRYLLALIIAIFNEIFYLIFSPLTLYVSYFIISLFYDVSLLGNTILLDGISFTFVSACTAATAYLLLTELVLLTRGISLKKSLKMLYIGYLSIFIMNILRILVLIFVYVNYGKNYFDILHMFFWHLLSTIFVVVVWILLTKNFRVKGVPVYSDLKSLVNK